MKRFIISLLLRLLIGIVAIIGSFIWLFTFPICIAGRCIVSWIIAPVVWLFFGKPAYIWLDENIGISRFVAEFGFACIFDEDFPIEYWFLNLIGKLKKYRYYHYDKEYLEEIENKKRREEQEKRNIKYREEYRKFIEQRREEILRRMYPYVDLWEIPYSHLQFLEDCGKLPKMPF